MISLAKAMFQLGVSDWGGAPTRSLMRLEELAMKNIKKRSILAAGAVVGLALAVVAVTPANAISRSQCGSSYLQLFSDNTTCWANAGVAYVTLYNVSGLSSGNNAGYVRANGGVDIVFGKWANNNFHTYYTINTIEIY